MNDIKYFPKYALYKSMYAASYVLLLPCVTASFLFLKLTLFLDDKAEEYYAKWKNIPEDFYD